MEEAAEIRPGVDRILGTDGALRNRRMTEYDRYLVECCAENAQDTMFVIAQEAAKRPKFWQKPRPLAEELAPYLNDQGAYLRALKVLTWVGIARMASLMAGADVQESLRDFQYGTDMSEMEWEKACRISWDACYEDDLAERGFVRAQAPVRPQGGIDRAASWIGAELKGARVKGVRADDPFVGFFIEVCDGYFARCATQINSAFAS